MEGSKPTFGSAHRSGRSRSQGGDRDIGVIVAAGAVRPAGNSLVAASYRGDDVGQLDICCDLARGNSQALRPGWKPECVKKEHDADFSSSTWNHRCSSCADMADRRLQRPGRSAQPRAKRLVAN